MSLLIAVIGKTGQLGRALLHESEGLGHEIISLGRDTLDLTSPASEIEAVITALPSGLDALAECPTPSMIGLASIDAS